MCVTVPSVPRRTRWKRVNGAVTVASVATDSSAIGTYCRRAYSDVYDSLACVRTSQEVSMKQRSICFALVGLAAFAVAACGSSSSSSYGQSAKAADAKRTVDVAITQ